MTANRWAVALALALHTALLLWSNWVHSPAMDEVAHLPAGISHWQFRDFSLYCVNPPLVKMIAAGPVVAMNPRTDWSSFRSGPGVRSEFDVGRDFARANAPRLQMLFFVARCALIPFSVLGAMSCLLFARYLFGPRAGLLALWLWCLSPNVLANASMITPDMPATSCGLFATYCFTRSLSWGTKRQAAHAWHAIAAGLLGVAILCKLTNLILIPVWAALLLIHHWTLDDQLRNLQGLCKEGARFALQMVFVLHVINLGYAYQGFGTPLRGYRFVSDSLRFEIPPTGDPPTSGIVVSDPVIDDLLSRHPSIPNAVRGVEDPTASLGKATAPIVTTDNDGASNPAVARKTFLGRVAQTWLGSIPLPFPSPMLTGIDLQKRDFERGMWSYLAGEHRLGGWWYYYLVAVLVKVPLGTWLCLGLGSLAAWSSANLKATVPVVLPSLAILALVSSQTGFSRYLRYLLPAFPYAFVYASQAINLWRTGGSKDLAGSCNAERQGSIEAVARKWVVPGSSIIRLQTARRVARTSLVLAVVWTTAVSLRAAPHWMSYFNELAGGPRWGHALLIDANIDWGQDLYFLREWYDQHPEARPLYVATHGMLSPRQAGIPSAGHPPSLRLAGSNASSVDRSDLGWIAVSVHEMHDRHGRYAPLLSRPPTAIVGQSIYVFDLTQEHIRPAASRIVSADEQPTATDSRPTVGDDECQIPVGWYRPFIGDGVRSHCLNVITRLLNHVSPRRGRTHANEIR